MSFCLIAPRLPPAIFWPSSALSWFTSIRKSRAAAEVQRICGSGRKLGLDLETAPRSGIPSSERGL